MKSFFFGQAIFTTFGMYYYPRQRYNFRINCFDETLRHIASYKITDRKPEKDPFITTKAIRNPPVKGIIASV